MAFLKIKKKGSGGRKPVEIPQEQLNDFLNESVIRYDPQAWENFFQASTANWKSVNIFRT